MSAVSKVFDTYELLEGILVYLPLRNLLLAQRTCKTWKSLIEGSKKIQVALCFRPLHAPYLHHCTEGNEETIHVSSFDTNDSDHTYVRPYLNPLLHFLFRCREMPAFGDADGRRAEGLVVPAYPMPAPFGFHRWKGYSAKQVRAFNYDKASWKRMFLTQPPISIVSVTGQATADEGEYQCSDCGDYPEEGSRVDEKDFKVGDLRGLKMGSLMAALRQKAHVCPDGRILPGLDFWHIKQIEELADDSISFAPKTAIEVPFRVFWNRYAEGAVELIQFNEYVAADHRTKRRMLYGRWRSLHERSGVDLE